MNTEPFNIPDLDSFADPYFFFSNNRDAELLYASPSVRQVVGYSPDEIVGRKYTEFLDATSPLNSDVADCHQRSFESQQCLNRLRVVETQDSQLKILRIQTHGKSDANGHVIATHGIAQDVTELYFVEQQMHQRLTELNDVTSQLSEREQWVVAAVTEGKLNKVIAKELKVSERSIEKIRARLVGKFRAETMAQVVAKATEHRMLRDVIQLANKPHFEKQLDGKMPFSGKQEI